MNKITLLLLLFSTGVHAQQYFNETNCKLYGDVVSRSTAYKHNREGRPTLLIKGPITEKRAVYIAKAF